jgi:hypothetical protein
MAKYKQLISTTIDTSKYLIARNSDFIEEQVSQGVMIDIDYNQVFTIVNVVGTGTVFRIVNLNSDGTFRNIEYSDKFSEDLVKFKVIKYDTDKFMIIGNTLITTYLYNISYDRINKSFTIIDEVDLTVSSSDFEVTKLTDTRFIVTYTNATTTSMFTYDIDEDGLITTNTVMESVADLSTNISQVRVDDTHSAVCFTGDTTEKIVLKVMAVNASTGAVTQKTTKTIGSQNTNNGKLLLIQDALLALFYAEEAVAGTTCTLTVQTYTITSTTYVLTAADSLAIEDYTDIAFANLSTQDLTKITDNRFVLIYSILGQGSATHVVDSASSTDVLSTVESFTYTDDFKQLVGVYYNSDVFIAARCDYDNNTSALVYHVNDGTETIYISLKNSRYPAINTGVFLKLSSTTALSTDDFTVTTYATLNEDTYPNNVDWFVVDTSTLSATDLDTGIINTTVPIEGLKVVFDYSEESS